MDSATRLHVIYDHPADWPDHVVVRGWQHGRAELGAIVLPNLEHARAWCRSLGLVRFNPDPAGDPVIVEVWAPIGTEWPFGMKEGGGYA